MTCQVRCLPRRRTARENMLLLIAAGFLGASCHPASASWASRPPEAAGDAARVESLPEGSGFGSAVLDGSRMQDGEVELRFVVAAWRARPDPDREDPGGALHVFEGSPPVHVATIPGRPGHRIGRRLERVTFEGEECFLVESWRFERDEPSWFIYSWSGEVLHELEPSSRYLLPAGDVSGDGTTDFYADSDLPAGRGLVLLEGSTGSALPGSAFEPGCIPRGVLPDLDGDGIPEVLCWTSGLERPLGVRLSRSGATEVRLDWKDVSRERDRRPRLEVASLEVPSEGGARSVVLVGDAAWDGSDVGRIAAFDLADGRLLYEIEDTFGKERGGQYDGSQLGYRLLVGPDIDGDGVRDVFAASTSHGLFAYPQIHAFCGRTGERSWTWHAPDHPESWAGNSLDLVPDQDGDGLPDLLVGGADLTFTGRVRPSGNVRILSTATGALLWEFEEGQL